MTTFIIISIALLFLFWKEISLLSDLFDKPEFIQLQPEYQLNENIYGYLAELCEHISFHLQSSLRHENLQYHSDWKWKSFGNFQSRKILVIEFKRFNNYKQYINVREYGNCMEVSHWLTQVASFPFRKFVNTEFSGLKNKRELRELHDLKSWYEITSWDIKKAIQDIESKKEQTVTWENITL